MPHFVDNMKHMQRVGKKFPRDMGGHEMPYVTDKQGNLYITTNQYGHRILKDRVVGEPYAGGYIEVRGNQAVHRRYHNTGGVVRLSEEEGRKVEELFNEHLKALGLKPLEFTGSEETKRQTAKETWIGEDIRKTKESGEWYKP
jgi:hypothetical protein